MYSGFNLSTPNMVVGGGGGQWHGWVEVSGMVTVGGGKSHSHGVCVHPPTAVNMLIAVARRAKLHTRSDPVGSGRLGHIDGCPQPTGARGRGRWQFTGVPRSRDRDQTPGHRLRAHTGPKAKKSTDGKGRGYTPSRSGIRISTGRQSFPPAVITRMIWGPKQQQNTRSARCSIPVHTIQYAIQTPHHMTRQRATGDGGGGVGYRGSGGGCGGLDVG